MRIVLADPDPEQAALIADVLGKAGHQLVPADAEDIALLILDERADAAIRHRLPPATPLLLLASRHSEDAVLDAMQGVIGDYLVKPVRRGELTTRVQVLLRRAWPEREEPDSIRFGRYVFEPKSGRASIDGRHVVLTQKEFRLALLLFRHLGRPLSRATIQDHIWVHEPEVPSRTIDTHVSRVRNKLLLKPENGFRLAPVYSYGYRLESLPERNGKTLADPE